MDMAKRTTPMRPRIAGWLIMAALILSTRGSARAQDVRKPEGSPLPPYAKRIQLKLPSPEEGPRLAPRGTLPVIVITGYWPPTNEMLRRWSTNLQQNPQGWIGGNWEGRGYDIHAFFPEFPPESPSRGIGDFEVDYQDTSGDWWTIIPAYSPLAIITFSQAGTTNGWELEGGNRTYESTDWTGDYLNPRRPTPELPIMQLEPPLTERFSTLPIAEIIAAVQGSGAAVDPFSTVIDNGRFLSNFIGYHGCWYRVLHGAVGDPAWLICSGHIHVGMNTDLAAAVTATEATLRALTTYLDKRRLPGDMNCDGVRDGADLQPFVLALLDPSGFSAAYPSCVVKNGDFNGDEAVTDTDIDPFAAALISE
jgi:hypothetical protein